MYVFMCMYIILRSDVQITYARIRYVYIYVYIYMYGCICVCESVYLCACVCDGVCVCELHTLHKQVRISYFIQTGALILKSECGGVVVGGKAFDIQKVYTNRRQNQSCMYICSFFSLYNPVLRLLLTFLGFPKRKNTWLKICVSHISRFRLWED